MDEMDVRKLIAIAMSYDARFKAGEATLAAWMEAARRGRWTYEAAAEAIHEHFVRSSDFIMPAHITTFVRTKMRQPAPVSDAVAHLEGARPASDEIRRKAMEQMFGRYADRNFTPPEDAA